MKLATSTKRATVVEAGGSAPLGPTVTAAGVNFSVFSKRATGMDLLLFDAVDDATPARVIGFRPVANHTDYYWHLSVQGLQPGQLYGFRAHGPQEPAKGYRFDSGKVLLDPYGRGVVVPTGYNRGAAHEKGDNAATAMKSVIVDLRRTTGKATDRCAVRHRRRSSTRCTCAASRSIRAPDFQRRTRYVCRRDQKIPYLKALGITAVELLPVFQFDTLACPDGVVNYWGYQPVSFFAPHQGFSSRPDPLGPVDEFRDMVKALHRAGIEVILDVVLNHTAEADQTGPTLCFRGFEERAYYILEGKKSRHANYTGCGNTLNANHPVVRRLIVDSLRYWVQEMHIDGFRFDLASILPRDGNGTPIPNPPILWDIQTDPVLSSTKLIAEAWDAAGLYQAGAVVGDAWKEWNGRFRDDIRSFIRGEDGSVTKVANRLLGSPEVYGHKPREAEASVNFVASHDGFTLNDVVSYNHKHNEANGEQNRDGGADDRSWNCGVEGPTDDPAIEQLRNRQVKNFLTLTMLSLGVPMILMGDEVRRTQRGNNNAYCQDDETSWFDWTLLNQHADVLRFTQLLTAHRVMRDDTTEQPRISLTELLRQSTTAWHGVSLGQPDWSPHSHSLAFGAELPRAGLRMHLIMNAYWEPLDFELPAQEGEELWRRWIDTSLVSPYDISPWQEAPVCAHRVYHAAPRSVVVLWAPITGLAT